MNVLPVLCHRTLFVEPNTLPAGGRMLLITMEDGPWLMFCEDHCVACAMARAPSVMV